jgi:hypothetical protein
MRRVQRVVDLGMERELDAEGAEDAKGGGLGDGKGA